MFSQVLAMPLMASGLPISMSKGVRRKLTFSISQPTPQPARVERGSAAKPTMSIPAPSALNPAVSQSPFWMAFTVPMTFSTPPAPVAGFEVPLASDSLLDSSAVTTRSSCEVNVHSLDDGAALLIGGLVVGRGFVQCFLDGFQALFFGLDHRFHHMRQSNGLHCYELSENSERVAVHGGLRGAVRGSEPTGEFLYLAAVLFDHRDVSAETVVAHRRKLLSVPSS